MTRLRARDLWREGTAALSANRLRHCGGGYLCDDRQRVWSLEAAVPNSATPTTATQPLPVTPPVATPLTFAG